MQEIEVQLTREEIYNGDGSGEDGGVSLTKLSLLIEWGLWKEHGQRRKNLSLCPANMSREGHSRRLTSSD